MGERQVSDTPQPLVTGPERNGLWVQVLVTVDGQDLRLRTDGVAPSATSGRVYYAGGSYTIPRALALRAQVVSGVAGQPATVLVEVQ